jgi:glycerate 2-kinase
LQFPDINEAQFEQNPKELYNYTMRNTKHLLSELFNAALEAVDPYASAAIHAETVLSVHRRRGCTKLFVVGFGKAACRMCKAIEDNIPVPVDNGVVITKYGHCASDPPLVRVYEAGHPLPDENGIMGTDEIIKLLSAADEKSLVVFLISGGGSALLVSPCKGITLEEKRTVTDLLLKAGADIHELNTVRKHISGVKGGRLAEIAHPAWMLSLILSDVIGDSLDVIASGPTSPDSSTYADAIRVLEKFALHDRIPGSVHETLQNGAKGLIGETPKEGSTIFRKVDNIIIGSNKKALEGARNKAETLGYNAEIISSEISGDAGETAKWLAQKAIAIATGAEDYRKPLCLLSGGETTVTVRGNGLGGRNTELALGFAIGIDGYEGITLLSAGTDGTDGPTDAAGAIVSGSTAREASAMWLDPHEYLKNNDSYNFFKKTGGLLITGPTGTNVMDIQIMIIE